MTVPEAAKLLEVTPALVYKLCEAGRIRHRRIGLGRGVIRIDPEHLEEFRRSCEVAPAPLTDGAPHQDAMRRRSPRVPDFFDDLEAERARKRAAKSKRG
jgi:excisionase family DNA binding protein